MRTTFVITEKLPGGRKTVKRRQINGVDATITDMVAILKKKGIDITFREYEEDGIAKEYKGIPIGHMLFGRIIWAKKEEDTIKLLKLLTEDGYYQSRCLNMPIGYNKF